MPDILHTVSMHAPPEDVFRAITARAGLRSGWVRQSDASPSAGSVSEFRVSEQTSVTMCVAAIDEHAHVAWKCVDGPPHWIGTEVSFELAPGDGGVGTTVRFRHKNWREPTDSMGRSSARWAAILFALKSFLETPDADDVYV
jgi:uncharacterized protein YndB with AHSA1/START domain